nr:porin family protein [uncultured Fluviicola sp.]
MKNTFIILTFISIGITSLNAQSLNRYDWGIEGGPNLSTFKDQPRFDARVKMFFSGGVCFQYNSRKIFSLRMGLSYQKKGYQEEVKDKGSSGIVYSSIDMTFNYHYLTLPILARATFGKKVKFFINAGPYASYLLAQRVTSKISQAVPVQAYNNKNFNGIKDWDLGITGGVGIAIPLKSWLISLEIRNYYGILNTSIRNSNGSNGGKIENYTNTTDLNIGVAYRLGFRDSK